jgi:hypothetical protein
VYGQHLRGCVLTQDAEILSVPSITGEAHDGRAAPPTAIRIQKLVDARTRVTGRCGGLSHVAGSKVRDRQIANATFAVCQLANGWSKRHVRP